MMRCWWFWLMIALAFLLTLQADDAPALVLASMDGITITVEEFTRAFHTFTPEMQTTYATPEGREKLLQELINRKLLLREARHRGILEQPEVVQQIKDITAQIVIVHLVNELKREVGLTEAEAREYYDTHPDEFRIDDQARIHHILIRPVSQDAAAEVGAKKKAEHILKLIQTGVDFGTLAKQISDDKASGARGGDLGYVTRDRLDPELAKLIFSMNAGDVGGPVKTSAGYHIVKVAEKRPGELPEFDRVENKVRAKALLDKQSQSIGRLLSALKKNTSIVFDKERLYSVDLSIPVIASPKASSN